MEAVYYVYEHWRPDKDEPFYVGKGKGRRAWSLRRNRFHNFVMTELASLGLCAEVRLVVGELTAKQANLIEIERIALYRRAGIQLANISSGGSGFFNPSEEYRQRLGEISSKRTRTPEWCAHIAEGVSRSYTPELRARKSITLSGRKVSSETCVKISKSKKNPSQVTRDRNRIAAKNSWKNSNWRANQISKRLGRIRITDGISNVCLNASDTIPDGWYRGLTKRKGWHKRASLDLGDKMTVSTRVSDEELVR
jgi:hypothetical protein